MGAMGKGLLHQCQLTPGFRCIAVADLSVDKAVACAQSMGLSWRVVHSAAEMQTAIIHRLELPQGRFERRIRLPAGRYGAVHRSAADGYGAGEGGTAVEGVHEVLKTYA